MKTYTSVFLLSLLVSLLFTPLVKKLAFRIGAIDKPGRRKIHNKPIPRLGGIAIFIGCYLPFCGLLFLDNVISQAFKAEIFEIFGIFCFGAVILILGIYDDIKGSNAWKKLVVEAAAATMMYYFGFKIEIISNPFGEAIQLGIFSLPVTVLWIVGVTNAVNFMDGLDGLAAGVSAFASMTIFVVSLRGHSTTTSLLCISLAGAAIGFLRYNFNPATIFMGDSGSLFLGFTLASIGITSSHKATAAVALLVPTVAFGLPLCDMIIAIIRRFLKGSSLFEGDGYHIHHKLLKRGLSQRKAVLILYAVNMLFCGLAITMMMARDSLVGLILLAIGAFIFIGAKHLGIGEVDYVKEYLEFGFERRRWIRFSNQVVRYVSKRVERATNFDRIWELITATSEILDYNSVIFEAAPSLADTDAFASNRVYVWRNSGDGDIPSKNSSFDLLIGTNGTVYGTLRFHRRDENGKVTYGEISVLEELCSCVANRLEEMARNNG